MSERALDHEQAAALLPWLANGTLEGEERERVERHVRECLPCRAELAEQARLQTLVRRQPDVRLSADAGFERLRTRLDGAPRPRFGPRRALWALAAAAAIVAVGGTIAAALLTPAPDRDAAYRTLSTSVAGGALVDVIFADGVSEAGMRELLEELGAEIVAGPSRTLGRYTLRIHAPAGAEVDVAAVVRRLRDDERVRFAGPTFSPPAPGESLREDLPARDARSAGPEGGR